MTGENRRKYSQADTRELILSIPLKRVEGKGVANIPFLLLPDDKLNVNDECILLVYLSKKGGGFKERISEEIRAKAQVVE